MLRRDQSGWPWESLLSGVAAFAVIAAVAGLASARSPPATPALRRVALIGDSYAQGLGPELTKLLPALRYEGHRGIGTHGWVQCANCGSWLASYQPAIVLVSLGVNDGNSANPTDYHAIVQQIHGLGATVIWIEPPAGVNTPATRSVIATLGVQTVPATATPLSPDHLHPQSYVPWAAEIAKMVR